MQPLTRNRFQEETLPILAGTLPIAAPSDQKDEASTKPAWTSEQVLKDLTACDGGTGVYAKAKAANGGKDPIIKAGNTANGGPAQVVLSTGEITLQPNLSQCEATQYAVQELSNLSHKHDFEERDQNVAAGNTSREAYINVTEQTEFDGIHNILKAFDACKDTWKCKTCTAEWARNVKDFDDYYKNHLASAHKEYYGTAWDNSYKAAYDQKHPATKP